MLTVMNDYVSKIHLLADDMTKNLLGSALIEQEEIEQSNILIKANRYIVDIKLKEYSMELATVVMNHFMECTRYHYSAYFVRFNEGDRVRYRYASCKENREGFYCDVVIG